MLISLNLADANHIKNWGMFIASSRISARSTKERKQSANCMRIRDMLRKLHISADLTNN
jgi:hypothetical protein